MSTYGVCWRCGATIYYADGGWRVVWTSHPVVAKGCAHQPSVRTAQTAVLDVLRRLA